MNTLTYFVTELKLLFALKGDQLKLFRLRLLWLLLIPMEVVVNGVCAVIAIILAVVLPASEENDGRVYYYSSLASSWTPYPAADISDDDHDYEDAADVSFDHWLSRLVSTPVTPVLEDREFDVERYLLMSFLQEKKECLGSVTHVLSGGAGLESTLTIMDDPAQLNYESEGGNFDAHLAQVLGWDNSSVPEPDYRDACETDAILDHIAHYTEKVNENLKSQIGQIQFTMTADTSQVVNYIQDMLDDIQAIQIRSIVEADRRNAIQEEASEILKLMNGRGNCTALKQAYDELAAAALGATEAFKGFLESAPTSLLEDMTTQADPRAEYDDKSEFNTVFIENFGFVPIYIRCYHGYVRLTSAAFPAISGHGFSYVEAFEQFQRNYVAQFNW